MFYEFTASIDHVYGKMKFKSQQAFTEYRASSVRRITKYKKNERFTNSDQTHY